VKPPIVEARHCAELGVAEPRRAPHDGLEHGLHVGGGARDDAQDLGGRGLLLQRLGQALFEIAGTGGYGRG
jgi:hypothetical protein